MTRPLGTEHHRVSGTAQTEAEMYGFPVEKLFLVDTVKDVPPALRRAKRLAAALGVSTPTVISRRESRELRASRPANRPHAFLRRTGAFDYSKGWTVVLDTYWDDEGRSEGIARITHRDGTRQMDGQGVCRSALELHCAHGCFHRCAYCFVDPHFLIACDLETLADRIPEYCARYPRQQLFKFDNLTDTIVLEPEYGASGLLVPLFADLDERYLLLYTKSDNVDHLLALNHGGHTIINWSLSPLPQSRTIETNTPDTLARIEAMRRCAAAGYTVRARISPIVPLEGWRDDFAEMTDALFSAVTPDVVTIDVVGWCVPEALSDAMDTSLLEGPFQDELREPRAPDGGIGDKYLFSHELRLSALRHVVCELTRRSPKTPVALCNETRRMWKDLQDVLTMAPENYACCCGPDSVPGHPGLACPQRSEPCDY